MIQWLKTLKQKQYINKIYRKDGSKGLQKLINLSMKKISEDKTNNLSQDEVEQVSKLLSKYMVD